MLVLSLELMTPFRYQNKAILRYISHERERGREEREGGKEEREGGRGEREGRRREREGEERGREEVGVEGGWEGGGVGGKGERERGRREGEEGGRRVWRSGRKGNIERKKDKF